MNKKEQCDMHPDDTPKSATSESDYRKRLFAYWNGHGVNSAKVTDCEASGGCNYAHIAERV